MSESVEILISADDQASKKFIDASANIEKSGKRVEAILNSLKSPADKYNEQLEELARLQKEGAISADQFAAAQAKITDKIKGNGNAIKEMGGKTKATTEFVGTLAALTGNSELASFASQMGGVSEKVGAFSDVAKQGGAASIGFKLGLVGLVGTLSFGLGQAIRGAISDTKGLERELQAAKDASNELNTAIANMQSVEFSNRKEDIELIQDPAEKQAAQKQLLDELNRNIMAVTGNVNKGKREVEEWADAWQITGERKAAAAMAEAELVNDKARLAALKQQRDEIVQMTSVRAQENELIRQSNEAKDKSESYLETLRQEVEYLSATREEQIKLDAARNTTAEDSGEAEQLLRDRDALLAKAEAAKELEQVQQRARDAEERAAEQAKQKAESEIQRIENIKQAEQERLELQRIEIEQGKEAAKVRSLMNQGVDEASARKLAADEASIERLKESQKGTDDPTKPLSFTPSGGLQAAESRLGTRGPADSDQSVKLLGELVGEIRNSNDKLAKLESIDRNLSGAPQINFAGVA